MKRSPIRSMAVVLILIMITSACGTFYSSQNNADMPDASLVVLPTATAANTPQPQPESQTGQLPPLTFEEMFESGIESGKWTHAEGLVLFLKYFVGEANPGEPTGVEDVVLQTGSGIIRLADEYLTRPDADPEFVAELQRLIRRLVPPQEVLDAISQPLSETRLSSPAKLAALSNPAPRLQSEEDCLNLIRSGTVERIKGGNCLYYRERVITLSTTVRVYFPTWTEFSEETIDKILDTLEKTAISYDRLDGLTLKSFYYLYWPPELSNTRIGYSYPSDQCYLSFWDADFPEASQQLIASEMFECVANWSFSGNAYEPYYIFRGPKWYFSNTVFKYGDLEWSLLPQFDQISVDTPIDRMYQGENFVFFQWLGNIYSPQKVVDFLHEFSSGQQENWLSYIAPGSPGDFTRFVVTYLSEGVADEDTGSYFASPSPPTVTDTITVDQVGELEFDSENLVAARYFVDYKKEKRFLQEHSFTTSGRNFSAVEAKLHRNLNAWSGLPPEIRSSCKEDVRYLYVAPHIFFPNTDKVFPFNFNVTKVEQAVCDPCLLGAWQIDNDSFEDYMTSIFDTYVPQTESFTTTIGGNYFMQFDTEGKVQAQREGLVVYVYLKTDMTIQPTLSPTNPGPQQPQQIQLPVYTSVVINSNGIGNYSTDGEFLKVTQFVDILQNVSTGDILIADPTGYVGGLIPVGMMFEFGPEYSSLDGPDPNETVLYACQGDMLDLFMNETDATLRLNRIEKILPTPLPTPNPTPNAQGKP